MKALVLRSPGELAICECPVPIPRPDELLVQTRAATICTSDLIDIRDNPFGIRLPMIMGHEGAGVVAAVGGDVTDFAPGDAVIAHPVAPCERCTSCKRGYRHLCDNMGHLGINLGGVFAEYFTVRADRARAKPADIPFATASLMEPICVCLEAIERAAIPPGGNVLILGDGPFGILAARLLRGSGAGRVLLTGRHPFRMRLAGCTALNERQSCDILRDIANATDGEGVDSAILCAGSGAAVQTAVAALRARGTLSLFSAVQPAPVVDLFRVHVKELQIVGSCNDMDCLERAVRCLEDPSLALGELVTHRLPFSEWREAFRLAEHGKDEAVKVALVWEEGVLS